MKVEVTGYQFWWDFHYPALGLRNSNELILPAGFPVELEITSKDVIHSFWVPGLAGKRDAIPGQKTLLHFTPKEPGNYYGFCAELCGPSHARMLFRVLVVPKEEFDRLWRRPRPTRPPWPTPGARRSSSRTAWPATGCRGGCLQRSSVPRWASWATA
jgi:cytochrome c oxidase subunit II